MNIFTRAKQWAIKHKVAAATIAVILIIGGYAFAHKNTGTGQTRYVLAAVEKGTVVSTISGSGQIAASNQVDIKPAVTGTITYVGVTAGQAVRAGDLLAQIDARDAENALKSAKLSLQKLLQTDPQTQLQNQHTIDEEKQTLAQTYDEAKNTIGKTMLDLPNVQSSLDDLYGNTGYLSYQAAYSLAKADRAVFDTAQLSRTNAESSLQRLSREYAVLSSSADAADTETLLSDTAATLKAFSQAIADAQSAVERVGNQSTAAALTAARSSLTTLTGTLTGDTNSVQSAQSTLSKTKNAIDEDTQVLNSATGSLDIQSAELAVEQKQQAYDDYFIRAPFDGVVASFTGKVGQSASGSIGTLITQNEVATITLNEVDVAKIALGQKATLTFDAIDGLSMTGEVAEIDAVGTVSQGVVNYTIQISLDTQDPRIKPGMSVSASIITASKADVLFVPNSAVKSSNDGKYVLVLDTPGVVTAGVQGVTSATAPTRVPVVVGIASNTSTEIVSGLTEGEEIVAKTISSAPATATQAPSLLGGGAVRTGGGATRSLSR